MPVLNRLLAAGLAFGLSATVADAASYTFTQGGFEGGGTITGNFTGVDLNDDGFIAFFNEDEPILINPGDTGGLTPANEEPPQEITAFSGTFSGSSTLPSFSFGLENLYGFAWDVNDGNLLGDSIPQGFRSEGMSVSLSGLLLQPTNASSEVLDFVWDVGPGPFNICDGSLDCGVIFLLTEDGPNAEFTSEAIMIAPVPLPASALLLAMGLGGLALTRGRAR